MAIESIITTRKYYKRNKILNIIRSNENISRYDVKKMTMYSMSTVLDIIDDLIASGMIYEADCEEPRVGRKPVWLRLNPEGGYFIGAEFNAFHLHCAMLNFTGEIIYQSEEDLLPDQGKDTILALLIRHIHAAIDAVKGKPGQIFAISVGIPGYLNEDKSIALSHFRLKDWENVPVKKILEDEFHLPCYLDNNVNVMAFAYKWLRYNGDCRDFLFVSIRTGVRIVPVINNHLILSRGGLSGELGHVKVAPHGTLCSCGGIGCLNSEISDLSILGKLKAGFEFGRFPEIMEMAGGDPDKVTLEMFCESAAQEHPDSLKLMLDLANILGEALGMAVNILAPEVVVLSGQLAHLGEPFFQEISKVLERNVVQEIYQGLKVTASVFNEYIGAIGAAAYAMQEEFDFIDKQI